MNPAAPDGAPPSGSVPVSIWVNTALPRRASKEALRREAIMPGFIDFHGLGVNTFVHVSFYSAKKEYHRTMTIKILV